MKCGERESNPQTFRRLALNQECLPFHHLRKVVRVRGFEPLIPEGRPVLSRSRLPGLRHTRMWSIPKWLGMVESNHIALWHEIYSLGVVPATYSSPSKRCGRQGSNLPGVSPTSPSSWRVYQNPPRPHEMFVKSAGIEPASLPTPIRGKQALCHWFA
jgi:hypothetical protein